MKHHGIIRALLLCAAALPLASPARAGDVKEIVATVCATCHGEDGNSLAPMFPKLAGQHAVYLEKQLKEFLNGNRKNEVMAPFLGNFTADDVPALAAYFASQKNAPAGVQDQALAERGKHIYEDGNTVSGVPACLGCHQPKGEGNARFPRLAGQYQDYIVLQIQNFKNGARTNDRGRVMRAVAERMTEDEVKAVAEYLAGM